METLRTSLPKTLASVFISFILVFSLVPGAALAEIASSGARADTAAAQLTTAAPNDLALTAQALDPVNETIEVTVGLPSESNVKKDIYVSLTYKDDFFAGSSTAYNDDLAYASVCLASAAINSNEGNYEVKSKNIVSLLQQIGCKDIELNDGYKAAPGERANIGVAIGYKDILVNDEDCRLFVVGVRGSNYEKEWATNMRVGLEGDAQGFHEARDGVLGFIMPYIKEHTADLPANTAVKIWGSGYCRGGTTLNLVFGWLNKWVYERNNGHTYNNLPYNSCYNADHTVIGATYDKSQMRYTEAVSFPTDYVGPNAVFSNDGLYAYPVNCPFSADATDVKNYEGLMTGFHNLINPEDWFPQVVMDWWGFKRYGYTHDHDITGTYPEDGALHARDRSVWDMADGKRSTAVSSMLDRLKAVDSETAIHDAFFRQYYFSKAGAIGRGIVKAGAWLWNKIMPKSLQVREPDVFKVTLDEKGEGNVFKSKDREMKYNQGAYYEEFMKFLIDAAGIRSDSAAHAREDYVNNYQDAFVDMAGWLLGPPLPVREKVGETASKHMKSSLSEVCETSENYILKMMSILWKGNKVGTIVSYTFAAIWAMNDEDADIIRNLLNTTLTKTFKELGIGYEQGKVDRLSKALGRLVYRFYDKEQKIGKFNFYHAMTMMKAGSSIGQAHWPEQSLAWFSQCKPGDPKKVPRADAQVQMQSQSQGAGVPSSALTTQEAGERGLIVQASDGQQMTAQADDEHRIFASFEDDPNVFYDCGMRDNGEIIGMIVPSDKLRREGCVITGWNMYRFMDFPAEESWIGTVDENYELSASDPGGIVLTPIYEVLDSKHVNLWLNASMTGFDQDKKIAEFDVYDGGSTYIAYTPLPDGVSLDGFDVVYYGDNPDLLEWEGVSLEGWVNAVEGEDDLIGYLPDDDVGYNDLPDGDVVDLYAAWYDPIVYGVDYHANRSQTDDYVVEDADWAVDGKMTVQGFAADDEGLNNPGKVLVGWNTKADGSDTSFGTGDVATLAQLGLGTREEYLNDLDRLVDLEIEAMPSHAGEPVDNSKVEALESELAAKYTTHLYAQWKTIPVSIKKAKVTGVTAKTWTGKALKQNPTVKLAGKTLRRGTDYTVTCKNNENVGKATMIIAGKGGYTGTITKTFKINPKGTSVKKLEKAKKAVKVTWVKQAKKMSKSRIAGYQIQVATDKGFTKNKKAVTVKDYTKTSGNVKGLKAQKTYYVHVRTYKTVGGVTYYSPWSKTKAVKTL